MESDAVISLCGSRRESGTDIRADEGSIYVVFQNRVGCILGPWRIEIKKRCSIVPRRSLAVLEVAEAGASDASGVVSD